MIFFETILVALSTYSAIPMPQFQWNEKNMRFAICGLPLVGILCGLLLLGWNRLASYLGAPAVLFAAVAVCLPLLLTGGIHMDGYMDTVDALASHQSRERKLEIMKDSSSGAFAVLYCGVYLLLNFGLFYAVYDLGLVPVCAGIYVFSRTMSALCAVTMPNARKSGMLCAFTENAHKKTAMTMMIILAVIVAALLVFFGRIPGTLCLLFGILATLWYRRMARKQFGGVTGDTAGFLTQVTELAMLLGLWLGGCL